MKSREFKKYLDFAYSAYQEHNISNQAYRQNGRVPYMAHPLWAATMLIADTEVPWKEREIGFKALILHDVLEDTSLTLPDWVEPKVKKLVQELTFKGGWEEKKAKAMSKAINIKLLMLYDVLSSMYELHVGEKKHEKKTGDKKRNDWKNITIKLVMDVEKRYGNIRIVQVGKAIIKNTNW
jgi:hypothetical protein